MVVALGPGKFYGSSLPRPRFYTDVKLNDHRIDPPLPVNDPLMSWAEEAHWSMGGLSFTRHRLQGRIEGNVDRLRKQKEKTFKESQKTQKKPVEVSTASGPEKNKNSSRVGETPSPPPAPRVIKRRRVVGLVDDEEQRVVKRGTARKLGDDFERVARETGMVAGKATNGDETVAGRTRSRRSEADVAVAVNEGRVNNVKKTLVKGGKKATVSSPTTIPSPRTRSSPRLVGRSPTVQ